MNFKKIPNYYSYACVIFFSLGLGWIIGKQMAQKTNSTHEAQQFICITNTALSLEQATWLILSLHASSPTVQAAYHHKLFKTHAALCELIKHHTSPAQAQAYDASWKNILTILLALADETAAAHEDNVLSLTQQLHQHKELVARTLGSFSAACSQDMATQALNALVQAADILRASKAQNGSEQSAAAVDKLIQAYRALATCVNKALCGSTLS